MSVRLFVGVPGAGKTQAMCDFCAAHASKHLFCVSDRANEWGDKKSPRWRKKTLPIFLAEYGPDQSDKMYEWLQQVETGIVCFQSPWEGDAIANLVRDLGNANYVDDEIDLFAGYKGWNTNPLRDFVHRGRHLPNREGTPCQVNILGAARRVQNLHTDLTSMADEVMVFRSQGKHTISRLREEGYVEETQLQTVRTMPNMYYFLWRSSGEITQGVLDNPYAGMKQH